jgi:competence protein ComGC
MIVTAVIGLLVAIAIPNFMKARESAAKSVCMANLKSIQSSVQMWALDTSADTDAVPTLAGLVPAYIKKWPKCGETDYEIPAVGVMPACPLSKTGHTIDSSGGS